MRLAACLCGICHSIRAPISHYPYGALYRKLVRPNGYPNHLYPSLVRDADTHSSQKRCLLGVGTCPFGAEATVLPWLRRMSLAVYSLLMKGTTPNVPGDISSAAIVMSSKYA